MYAITAGQDKMYELEYQIKKYEDSMNFMNYMLNKKFCKRIKSDKFKNIYRNFKYAINAVDRCSR